MDDYRNEHLDRAIALIVLIVFFVALFYAVMIISQYWQFFRVFFSGIIILLALWLVLMLYNITWRYRAKTDLIMQNIPAQIEQRKPPFIHGMDEPQDFDYNNLFMSDDDE